jgi:hypothetical protein
MAKKEKRAWSNLSEEAFKKVQDLEAVLATNKETVQALQESVNLHTLGLGYLNVEGLETIKEQFEFIISRHGESKQNLMEYNINAKLFLDVLRETEDRKALDLVEYLLKLVAFK